ncbi:protein SCAR1-like [Senna tora]|uniref:Protein SCAR n=1 Tax=Senna tora TaxID=362788 RepID=A0A834VYZ7_9FABA|nr:protein SCAR1-like [Senna tora]
MQVRNEYGLGRPELYKETNREDPKAVLDGVAVAGLVGILRQLGDLADFAAEVFHGLQEQVLTTASRSHKLMLRAKNIEASLPPLEKAILAQTSHIHFAYTSRNIGVLNESTCITGCEWHSRTTTAHNHFIYADLPHFILDSYEDCRDPPRLDLLDKFDAGGSGSCLRRYSDPTFFKRVSAYSDEAYTEKIERARKSSGSKKKRSSKWNGEILRGEQMHSNRGRMQSTSHVSGQTSSSQKASAIDVTLKSDLDHSKSFDSGDGAGYIECVFHQSNSVQPDEQEYKDSFSSRLTQKTDTLQMASPAIDGKFSHDSFEKQIFSTSNGLTWDEKEEIVDYGSQPCDRDETREVLAERQSPHMHEDEAVTSATIDCIDFLCVEERYLKPVSGRVQTDENDGRPDNYLNALNTIALDSENDHDYGTKQVEQFNSHISSKILENEVDGATSTILEHDLYDGISQSVSGDSSDKETLWDFPDTLQEIPPLLSEPHLTSLRSSLPLDVPVNIERTKILADSHNYGSSIHEKVPHISGNSDLDCSVVTNPLDDVHSLKDKVSASTETVAVPVNIEGTKNLADSYASEIPVCEEACEVSVFDCYVGISPLGAHTPNDTMSASIETDPSDVPVSKGKTKTSADSHASESSIFEQVPHKCGNSVLNCSVGTNSLGNAQALNETVSASSETVSSNVPNVGRTKNLADSDASETPNREQVPHTSGNSALDYSIGTNPMGDAHTLNVVSSFIQTVPSDVPINLERNNNLADPLASESPIHEQVPCICGNSVLNCSVSANPLGNAHNLNVNESASIETDVSSASESCDLPDEEADRINSNICDCKDTPAESANDPSVGLWTNGGLLGLEPSKPPDFMMSTSLNQGSLTSINETDSVLNHNSMLKSNGSKEEQFLSAEIAELNQDEASSRCLISHCDDQACISGKTSDCHQLSSGLGRNNEEDLEENRVLAPASVVPAAHNSKTTCTEPMKGSGENSPLLFGLGHKLLLNSFRRRVSFDEKSGPDNSLKTRVLNQSGENRSLCQSLPETTFQEQVSYEYSIYSPPPSPPLEHMKISFHPINELETSKLKLKFPDRSNHRESMRDMFPAFRLVPEPSIPLHDSGSNSDDGDTFGRSSPFVSDDCLSPHSDYNSDQWGSDASDTPNISDHETYDSSHRISFTESKLSSQETRGLYTQETSLSGPSLDFPSFDTVNPVLEKECNKHSDFNNYLKLQSQTEPTPPAPPLPPNQWWVSNLQLNEMNEKKVCISEDTEQINNPNISESTFQPRPAQVEQNITGYEDLEFHDHNSCKMKDKLNQQNMNGKREDQVGIGKDMDEKQDFLHQIRTKSFNLKHTVTGKPNAITSPTTNVKVTAILEKATAIRQLMTHNWETLQVVASDDGDNWSDT